MDLVVIWGDVGKLARKGGKKGGERGGHIISSSLVAG